MGKSKIDWTDSVWNVVTGCTPAGPGCKNCWAKNFAPRLAGRFGYPEKPHQFDVTLHLNKIGESKKWKKPRKIFACSMGDLFHAKVPDWFLYRVFDAMIETPRHTYQVLTKRIERVGQFWKQYSAYRVYDHKVRGAGRKRDQVLEWPEHIWIGTSTENQAMADKRIPILLSIPAAIHFVSVEPMLEEIDIAQAQYDCGYFGDRFDIDWIVCGCESGPGRRPFDIEWARALKSQCIESKTPFFFKQMQVGNKVVKMPELDGQVWAQFPEVSQ